MFWGNHGHFIPGKRYKFNHKFIRYVINRANFFIFGNHDHGDFLFYLNTNNSPIICARTLKFGMLVVSLYYFTHNLPLNECGLNFSLNKCTLHAFVNLKHFN